MYNEKIKAFDNIYKHSLVLFGAGYLILNAIMPQFSLILVFDALYLCR